MSPLLSRVLDLVAKLKAGGAEAPKIAELVRTLVHGPLVALAVALTPNKADDAVLELLQGLFPAK